MKCDKKTMLLYAVTDRAWVGRQSLYEQVECALKGGATCVQVREKKLGDEDFLEEAKQIAALCKRYGVPLFINDNVDVAIACGAEGVHVGQEDMAAAKVREKVGNKMMIGVSVHSVEEAKQAVRDGADCLAEGKMEGKGTSLICRSCNKEYRLTEIGTLECLNGEAAFTHVPDWYTWERQCVREELESGAYQLDIPVQICMMVNMREICRVGEGRLHHDENGFHLTGCGGKLDYFQKPEASYSLYADYFWYEIGDMLCIGDHKALYYCFPQGGGDVVAKTRLAAEELYKLKRAAKARG